MHCLTVFCRCSTQYSFQLRTLWCILLYKITVFDVFVLFIQCKNCMTTSESKGRFFKKTNRFESIRITNRIESIRIANWNALLFRSLCLIFMCTNYACFERHVLNQAINILHTLAALTGYPEFDCMVTADWPLLWSSSSLSRTLSKILQRCFESRTQCSS